MTGAIGQDRLVHLCSIFVLSTYAGTHTQLKSIHTNTFDHIFPPQFDTSFLGHFTPHPTSPISTSIFTPPAYQLLRATT